MSRNESEHRHEAHEFVMLFLSISVLCVLFVETVIHVPPAYEWYFSVADTIICCFFLGDFFLDLMRAPNKRAYMKWGWIDLVSSIPHIGFLGWGRVGRMVRVLRILRAIRAIRIILHFIYWKQVRNVLATVAMISFTLMIFAAIAILNCEDYPESNIKTLSDALWWAFATVTTVGYGDRYPVTPEGRLIAAVLMTVGVGLFGTMTAGIAAFFLESDRDGLQQEIAALREDIQQLRQSVEGSHERDEAIHPNCVGRDDPQE